MIDIYEDHIYAVNIHTENMSYIDSLWSILYNLCLLVTWRKKNEMMNKTLLSNEMFFVLLFGFSLRLRNSVEWPAVGSRIGVQ